MINTYDVLETIRMIQDDCLDIRTITMGISLLDCIDSDINVACENVYKKITAKAARLVEVGEQIEKELGIPIINKRISVTPIAIVSAACKCSPVPFAQLAAPYSEEIPVVFSAVTDPIGAGLCDSLESTGANITGTSDKLAITKILDFALEMKPEIKTLGYLYNTGEDNSVSTLKEVKAYCEEKGITVIEGAASNTSEVQEAAQNLAAKCDAVFSPNDNTIAGAMGTVTEVMNKAKVPMFVGADSMVMDGGLGTVGIEYSDLGKETANMAAQILSGEKKASEIPIKVFNEDLSTYINKTTADTIGITIPDDIANGEKTVYFD